ncbi:helix-hairpin-helix domain-containing protein [Micromonospora sp. LH3U1]|uniref:helix-hairpin-helix domain-containing protein n=1 Tax=Micromonospora sp. LH3U1 TaxID=3018339 RepID=UPI00234B6C67|nr:helix-hairpin-helix domain-containing protein [Micromonospora sp. LH3U1]WCN79012.1 helix-hairpin-helix domain-containing protein [Micromonospora sp. LH3U1]
MIMQIARRRFCFPFFVCPFWRLSVAWFINQSLFVVLAAFLLGLLVGWLLWGNRRTAPPSSGETSAPQPATAAETRAAMTPTPHAEPRRSYRSTGARGSRRVTEPVVARPEPVEPPRDELERIEGIGPKMANALRAAGIHTFRQLAEADDTTRRAAIEGAGLTFAPSLVTWGRQAQLLADGDEEGFAELTELLVAGRDTGRA